MIISRQLAFFAFFFTTCFSWSYNYHLKGSLYKTKEDDSMLYSYEELQDTATESKLTHKVNGIFDEKIIQIKNKAYLNKLHEVQCEEINPLPSTMFDIYEEIKSHFTKEIHSINVEGRECQCHSNEKESMVYCDAEASNPCYLKYHDEKNYTITLFVSFFNPLKKDKNPFIPSEKYFCSDLGTTTTVREFKFPKEFSGQQIETSQKGRKITNLSFSASQNMFIRDDLNKEVYIMDMGTVLTINSTNNNIRAKKMDDDDLSFVETSDDTFEPRLVFNLYGHTVPGYYIDINEKERRYTMKFKDYINNIYTVRNDGKEIAYRVTKYDSSHEELSTFDIFYESESKLSREILESLDFENAYLQNNKDKELIFEFHSELILIENSREERSLGNQISKEFNRFFNQTINTLRIMARRVEIDFNKVYFYAKIINTNFFHDVYVSRKGEPTVKADKTETALNLQNCENLCSKEKCKMYYFKKEKSNQKENCLLFKRFLKKSEVDATKEDKLGIRVSYSDPYTIQEIEKKIETRMKESQWQFEAMLLDGKKTMLKSKSIPKHYSVEETNNLSKINDFNSDIIKSKSLNVSKNSLANGKLLSQGKISLSKCVDNFFNARNYMKVNKFQYNNDLNQCYLVIEAKNLLTSKSNDLYEYNPELSFKEITYPLQEDGFIGTTDSISVCSDICLSNSTQFIKIDQKNAKTPVPFEKICQGVQYDTSSKNCYLLFNSWEKYDNIAFNVNLRSYKREIEDSFQVIISDFSSDLKNLGKKLPYSENPFSTCIDEMNTECAYVITCIDSIKKTTFAYGNTLEMSITSIINDSAQIKYSCSLFKNIQTASKIIVKTNSIFEKKYRSLTNGGVAGLTIGMMVVGVIIGVLVAKLVVSRF